MEEGSNHTGDPEYQSWGGGMTMVQGMRFMQNFLTINKAHKDKVCVCERERVCVYVLVCVRDKERGCVYVYV
jgi:hypothetical protein